MYYEVVLVDKNDFESIAYSGFNRRDAAKAYNELKDDLDYEDIYLKELDIPETDDEDKLIDMLINFHDRVKINRDFEG